MALRNDGAKDRLLHGAAAPPEAKSAPSGASYMTKAALLALLVLQNGALNICARWSRVLAAAPPTDDESASSDKLAGGYAKTSLVLVVEAAKILVAFGLLAWDRGAGLGDAWQHLRAATLAQPREVLKLLVPSSLYVVQNNLVLVAADNLEGPVMAVLGQLKIVTTALFSVTLLKRSLAARQWVALVALVAGVSAVQLASNAGGGAGDGGNKNAALGVSAVLAAAATSGFAGVYFEKVLKGSDMSVWVRNIHLAAWGVFVALGGLWTQPGDVALVRTNGLFGGYNGVVWTLVAVQALGGLLVAAVVKYTDNILKAFATSAALVGISVVSAVYFGFPVGPLFAAGAALVVYSMFLYGDALPGWATPPGLAPAPPDHGVLATSRPPAPKLKADRAGGRGRDANAAAATDKGALLVEESGDKA